MGALTEWICAVNNTTLDTMLRPANHVYPEAFDYTGLDPAAGLPVVRMWCGS